MSEKLNQNNIYVDSAPLNKKDIEKAKNKMESEKSIPPEYFKIKLTSVEKFDAPSELHFRNYTMNDMITLDSVRPEDYKKTLINILTKMNYEKFDCMDLTEEEYIEILFTIYGRWNKNIISNVPSYIVDLNGDITGKKENVHVDIKKIKTRVIDKKFAEPFKITHNKESYIFRLPRLRDYIFAQNIVEDKYKYEKRCFSNYFSENIDDNTKEYYDKQEELENLLKKISKEASSIALGCCLVGKDSELDHEEKIKLAGNIDPQFFAKYAKIRKQYTNYGVDPIVKVFNTGKGKFEKRRCLFREDQFITNLELPDDTDIDVVFGVSL